MAKELEDAKKDRDDMRAQLDGVTVPLPEDDIDMTEPSTVEKGKEKEKVGKKKADKS